MSTDPRDEGLPPLPEPIDCKIGPCHFFTSDQMRDYARPLAAEIARLTAELYDEKAVNETQRYELKDRLQKQLAAEAELKEARRIVQALECLFSPYATDSTQRDWMDRATAMTKGNPHGRNE